MSTTSTARQSLSTIEAFLDEVGHTVKSAEANTEPGSQGGPTTHPVKGVPDNTRPATEGARSAENTKDVKEDQGKPSVDSTPEATAKKAEEGPGTPGTAASDQLQIGTKKGPTGTDVPAVKEKKDDPGSSHPARTDNDALNGGKFAGDINTMPLNELAKIAKDLGEGLCATLTVEAEKAAAAIPAATVATTIEKTACGCGGKGCDKCMPDKFKKKAALDPQLAAHVGWDIANILGGTLDKQAADAMVVEFLTDTIKQAEDDADRTADYLDEYFATKRANAQKAADGGMPPGGGDPSGAGAPPAGGDPAAGGDPSGGGAGGAGGAPSEQEIMQLLQQLEQAGVTPEEIEQAIAAEQAGGAGGAGGGMPPGAGGGMPPGAAGGAGAPMGGGAGAAGGMPGGGMQVAASDKSNHSKEAVASYITEVITRSRNKAAAAKAAAAK